MTFKDITAPQHEAFISSLASGRYNLLLGAGSSMDSCNIKGKLPDGETFKNDLCKIAGASQKHSLQRVFNLLTPDQISEHVTKRFIDCTPGKTAELLSKFLWKRIFTWNIDDVIEKQYEKKDSKQKLIPIHYNDEYQESQNITELMLIHLHGYVAFPSKGYVFSRDHYIQQIQTINPWMSVLSNFMKSEPIIISGTSLDEPDLDYYLSYRSDYTAREDRGPSILVTRDDDAVTRDLCLKHNLLQFHGWTSDFLEYCAKAVPRPPVPEDLIPAEINDLLPDDLPRAASIAFNADFELIPGIATPSTDSRFQYGHAAHWRDLARNLDIPRKATVELLADIEKALKDTSSPAKLMLLSEPAGTGKTTIIRRIGFELAQRGISTFSCSALSRIGRSTTDVLNSISSPVVILVDNLADQATAISEILENTTKSDLVVLGAERSYRKNYLDSILAKVDYKFYDSGKIEEIDIVRLIDKYFENGNLGVHDAVKRKKEYARLLSGNPIAISCCRILNDFKPLERIIDDIMGDAKEGELDRYLCASLAQYCFTGGVKYEVLLGAAERRGIRAQFDANNPLPLAYVDSEKTYVVPENSTVAERVLERAAGEMRPTLLRTFISLANEIQPFVSRATIKRRTPEARLAGRLFDYDDIVGKLLGSSAEEFYKETRESWKWNSRYWEQVALLKLSEYQADPYADQATEFLDQAVQHARHAVAIENHPFGLTTLGKVLMTQMLVPGYTMSSSFNEAFGHLGQAIEKEALWSRRAIQPFVALFKGTDTFLEHGGNLDASQRDAMRDHIVTADERFRKEPVVMDLITSLRGRLKL